jgi:hypothetical protein
LGGFLLAFLSGVASGCYTYSPLPAMPAPGSEVSLGLNDQGRIALGQSVGPAARTIEGTLSSRTDSLFVVNVNSVSYFNGLTNKWSGEPVNVGASFVQEARLRQFSRGRTALMVGLASAAVLGFAMSRGLFSRPSPDPSPIPPPPEPQ